MGKNILPVDLLWMKNCRSYSLFRGIKSIAENLQGASKRANAEATHVDSLVLSLCVLL